jgi:hypothetical protein
MDNPIDKEFNHAANDSPRSGSSKSSPMMWAAVLLVFVAIAVWLAVK